MKTDTTDTTTTDRVSLSPATIFSLLAEDRRRYTIQYLAHRVGAVPLGEVAEHIALREDDPTRDRYERVITGLHHIHVPRLREAGVVRYDPKRETVERLATADQLTPYLNLAAAFDLH